MRWIRPIHPWRLSGGPPHPNNIPNDSDRPARPSRRAYIVLSTVFLPAPSAASLVLFIFVLSVHVPARGRRHEPHTPVPTRPDLYSATNKYISRYIILSQTTNSWNYETVLPSAGMRTHFLADFRFSSGVHSDLFTLHSRSELANLFCNCFLLVVFFLAKAWGTKPRGS